MMIKEVEMKTGITKQNIRFYEREGLIHPTRNSQSQYREFSEADVRTLKEIKLYRKLNISLEDIKLIQKGVISISGCMERYSKYIEEKMLEMNQVKRICDEIYKDVEYSGNLEPDRYLDEIESYERSGHSFPKITRDFMNYAKGLLPPSPAFWFEPRQPILKRWDFTDELIKYCNTEKKDLTILHESMEPVVLIDGVKYLCMLEQPRMLAFPLSIFFAPNTYGFKFVYAYKYE